MSNVYNSVIPELAPHLSPQERSLLHVVHERFRMGDDLLAGYHSELLRALHEDTLKDPWETYINRMSELADIYENSKQLLQSYLDGTPVDVLYLSLSEEERKQIVFK